MLVGNPNVGKTTLFNRLTGERARIGNYPGVTVERRSGRLELADGRKLEVVDVPGAYSLSARSAEEQIALEAVLGLDENPRPSLARRRGRRRAAQRATSTSCCSLPSSACRS